MPFDVNGRPASVPRWRRVFRSSSPDITIDHPDLVPVAGSSDDTVASSAVLAAAAAFDQAAQSVLVHVLDLPVGSVAAVLALVRQDNYARLASVPDGGASSGAGARAGGDRARTDGECVVVARVQMVDALHVSQERSRMASVAARHGGEALSWRVLQIPG